MPKELTHWILADRSLMRLDEDSRTARLLRSHRALYLAGAVLPDTLLHLLWGSDAPQALSLARAFHDSRGNSYLPLIQAEQAAPIPLPDPLLACMLGVLSHMQADIVFHPFVFAQSGADMALHYRLETDIDCGLYLRGGIPPVRRLADLIDERTRPDVIDAMAALFAPRHSLPRHALEKALSLHCRFQAMYGSTFWQMMALLFGALPVPLLRAKRHLFYPLRLSAGFERLDGEGNWRHPASGALQKTTLDDLAETAVARTVALFEKISGADSLSEVLIVHPGENLLTGVPS